MNREYRETPLDGGSNPPKRVTVTYTSDPCPSTGVQSAGIQFRMLQTVVETPGMLDCGYARFQTFKMTHDGNRWVIVMEANNLR